MALNFNVDPAMPEETLQGMADVCGALAASLAVRLINAEPGTGATICLDASAMRGFSAMLNAVGGSANAVREIRAPVRKMTNSQDLLTTILNNAAARANKGEA